MDAGLVDGREMENGVAAVDDLDGLAEIAQVRDGVRAGRLGPGSERGGAHVIARIEKPARQVAADDAGSAGNQ